MADLEQTIRDAAAAPAKASAGDTSAEQHNLADLIAADKYLAAKSAVKGVNRGIIFNKLVPPGAD